MINADKEDGVVEVEGSDSPGTTPGKKITPNDSEESLRAQVAHYEVKIDEVADLVARVRHEINNPLTGVLGQAQLLLREELSEKARQRAETIENLAIRIRDVVAQLRAVQKTSKPDDLIS
jgi:signal transduction histidine kinase